MSSITKIAKCFNETADFYHCARSRYPENLIDTLAAAASLTTNSRLLEIGPGTGQATIPLAKRGYQITAIELGAALAEMARRQLRPFPNARVITGAFEDVHFEKSTFDLIVAAAAFHWIKPGIAFHKSHQLLKDGGHLAIIHTYPVSDGEKDAFFYASQPIYRHYFPKSNHAKKTLPNPQELRPWKIDESLFELVDFHYFPAILTYTAQEYTQLLSTYSYIIRLPQPQKKYFLRDIAQLIDTQFGGALKKYFCFTLTVAAKK